VLRHAGAQLPLQLLQVRGDGVEGAHLLVQPRLLLRDLQQHGLCALTNLLRPFALPLLEHVVLLQRRHAQPQVAFEEDVRVVRGDHVAVL